MERDSTNFYCSWEKIRQDYVKRTNECLEEFIAVKKLANPVAGY